MIKVLNDYGVLHELVMNYDAEMLPCRVGETVRVSFPVHAWLNDEDIVDSEMVVVLMVKLLLNLRALGNI